MFDRTLYSDCERYKTCILLKLKSESVGVLVIPGISTVCQDASTDKTIVTLTWLGRNLFVVASIVNNIIHNYLNLDILTFTFIMVVRL